MALWRRDPALWSRTPIHRYARPALRDREAAIRTRCFSRSPPSSAQYNDDASGKRPEGLSKLEWMQLQHYRQWRQRLNRDPYKALFGPSEDMLKGKGLSDWEWVHQSFPRWIIRDMNVSDWMDPPKGDGKPAMSKDNQACKPKDASQHSTRIKQTTSAEEAYPKKINISVGKSENEKESVFPEPSSRYSRFEKGGWTTGIVSPSDPRRPREQQNSKEQTEDMRNEFLRQKVKADDQGAQNAGAQASSPQNAANEAVAPVTQPSFEGEKTGTTQLNSTRERSFINQFLTERPQLHDGTSSGTPQNNKWRQTVLDRRVSPNFSPKPNNTERKIIEPSNKQKYTNVDSADSEPASLDEPFWSSTPDSNQSEPVPSSRAQHKADPPLMQDEGAEKTEIDNPKPKALAGLYKNVGTKATASKGRFPSVLKQLPEDDIDFLSAADIRASMGHRKGILENNEDQKKSVKELEERYRNVQHQDWSLDPMLQSSVINDQHVRRTERELQQKQAAQRPESTSSKVKPTQNDQNSIPETKKSQDAPATTPQLETSIDRMTRWLTSGSSFAQHFWQVPVPEKTVTSLESYLKDISSNLQKGRRAMKQIKGDLESGLPSAKPLLERLAKDENALDVAVASLSRANNKPTSRQDASKMRGRYLAIVQRVRRDVVATNSECKKGCRELEGLDEQERRKVSWSLRQALKAASIVLQQNAKLSRMLLVGFQGRLEAQAPIPAHEPLYRDIGHRLLALQDTQAALARVVERAMQVYNILPSLVDPEAKIRDLESESAAPTSALHDAVGNTPADFGSPKVSANEAARSAAAFQKLEDEIHSQMLAMRGLSDDGYTRSPKSPPKKSFDNPGPLENSLFRPFGFNFQNLGKETDEKVDTAKEAARKKMEDHRLVKEVRKAYEDTYGPITVNHRQPGVTDKEDSKAARLQPEDASTLSEFSSSPNSMSTEGITQDQEPATKAESTQGIVAAPLPKEHDDQKVPETIVLNAKDEVDNDVSSVVPRKGSSTTTESARGKSSTRQLHEKVPLDSITAATKISANDHATDLWNDHTQPNGHEYVPLSTSWKILTFDAVKDELIITNSETPPPREPKPPVPLHEALVSLQHPSKFVPHMPSDMEVFSVKPDMLVLRDAQSRSFNSMKIEKPDQQTSMMPEKANKEDEYNHVNPVDGTTRLSPTGFSGDGVGVEELERDFEERRRLAGEHSKKIPIEEEEVVRSEKKPRERKKGGGASSVFKTAIVAGAVCYVCGVVGELLR